MKKDNFCYIRGSNCILFHPPEAMHPLMKKTIDGIAIVTAFSHSSSVS